MGNLASSGTPGASNSLLTDPSRSRHPHLPARRCASARRASSSASSTVRPGSRPPDQVGELPAHERRDEAHEGETLRAAVVALAEAPEAHAALGPIAVGPGRPSSLVVVPDLLGGRVRQARPRHAHTEGGPGGGEAPLGVALAALCEVAQVVCPPGRRLVAVARHEDAPPASRPSRSTTVALRPRAQPSRSRRPVSATASSRAPGPSRGGMA